MTSSNSSNSSTGEGNTKPPPKQISPAKYWCFTLFNYKKEDIDEISSIVPKTECLIVGEEICPKTKKGHLQGFIEFKNKCRPLGLFKNKTYHFEKCKGTKKQNIEYCSKENNIILSHGVPKPIKIIKDLYPWQKDIIKIIEQEPDDRKIYWFWSAEGNVGKTALCKYLTVKHDAITLSGKAADIKNGIAQYYIKKGETPNLIVVNIPKSFNKEYLSYEGLENIKDMYFYSGKYEGTMICGNCPHLIVFSNEEPDFSKMSSDRFVVQELL